MSTERSLAGWIAYVFGLLRAVLLREAPKPITVTVGPADVVIRHPFGLRPVITVLRGEAWITQAGDPRDYCIGAGEDVRLSNQGSVAIQALGDRPCHVRLHDL